MNFVFCELAKREAHSILETKRGLAASNARLDAQFYALDESKQTARTTTFPR